MGVWQVKSQHTWPIPIGDRAVEVPHYGDQLLHQVGGSKTTDLDHQEEDLRFPLKIDHLLVWTIESDHHK